MIITIDGPAGSGKSSVAKTLAEKLNIYYLNTGLLYRAVAYIWLKKDPNLEKIDKIQEKDLFFTEKIEYKYINNIPNIFYDYKNITNYLSNNRISHAASILSAKKEVRGKLLELQGIVAQNYDIVAEGRDCGSVIFPNADHKFYLTANLDVRAKRIFQDKVRDNSGLSLKKVKEELEQRDERDMNRDVAPLKIPEDAIIIDNSDMDQKHTILCFLSRIKQ
ncbi:MAG: (d)CMP kinase [bacterium]